jgi:hypothetical protein
VYLLAGCVAGPLRETVVRNRAISPDSERSILIVLQANGRGGGRNVFQAVHCALVLAESCESPYGEVEAVAVHLRQLLQRRQPREELRGRGQLMDP